MVTPLTREGELIEQGLKDALDHTINGGVHGVFVLGSSGEIFGLTDEQKRRVIEITVEHVAGRVPVYAGASEITTRDCIKTMHMINDVGGVDAVSVLTPYFVVPTQHELVAHFRAIAGETDLPVLLYNNPGKTLVPISVAAAVELADLPNVVGVKDSSGNLGTTADFLRECPENFAVLVGKDTLIYAGLAMGAKGAIASTANIAPRLVAEIYNAWTSGDQERALRLQEQLAPVRYLVDQATFPVVLKEGLRMSGVDAGYCLAPATDFEEALRAPLQRALDAAAAVETTNPNPSSRKG